MLFKPTLLKIVFIFKLVIFHGILLNLIFCFIRESFDLLDLNYHGSNNLILNFVWKLMSISCLMLKLQYSILDITEYSMKLILDISEGFVTI